MFAGAAVGAIAGAFHKKGSSLNISDNVFSSMTTNVTLRSNTDCYLTESGTQVVSVNSSGQLDGTGCTQCQNMWSELKLLRQNLEFDAGSTGHYRSQSNLDADVDATDSTDTHLNACTLVCTSTVVQDVSQTETFKVDKQSCQDKLSSKTELKDNFKAQLNSLLKNQQDIFGQLESALVNTKENMVTNISNVMSESVDTEFENKLQSTLENTQTVSTSGGSIFAKGLKQNFSAHLQSSLTVSDTVQNQLSQSASFSVAQSLINKNDTVGDLTKSFLQTIQTWTSLVQDSSSQIMVILAALAVTGLISMGIYHMQSQKEAHVMDILEASPEPSRQPQQGS